MNDVYEQIKFIVNSVWQRRFSALAVAWFVCLAGWTVVATMPNAYTSSARIFIDTSNILRPLLKGILVESDIDAELDLMKRMLTSRSSLSNVARLTDLDLTVSTPQQMEALLDSLKSRIGVNSKGAKLLTLSFTDSDPVRARDVTQALITTFIEMNLGHGREDIDAASRFLDSQIANYERQLQEAEKRLVTFKHEKLSKLPDQGSARQRIASLKEELDTAQTALRKATSQRDLLRQQSETPGGIVKRSYREELQQSLRELRSRYTDRHPEVIGLRRKIEALSEAPEGFPQTDAGPELAMTDRSQEPPNDPAFASAAVKEVNFDLVQLETDIAFYKRRIARTRQETVELERALSEIPATEAELTKLNRDYDVLKSQFTDLVNRREQASISRESYSRDSDVKFRILESPRVPGSPAGPSRSLLLMISLFGGMGAGVVFALLLGIINEAASDPKQLQQWFGLPILGTVSTIDNFRHHSLRVAQSSAFFGCFALLFVAFAGLMMVERQSGLASLASNRYVNSAYEGVRDAPGKLKAVITQAIGRI